MPPQPSRPSRFWYRMKGGPWHRKILAPPVGATMAEVKIHGRRHLYELDPATLTGTYRGEPDAGPALPYRSTGHMSAIENGRTANKAC